MVGVDASHLPRFKSLIESQQRDPSHRVCDSVVRIVAHWATSAFGVSGYESSPIGLYESRVPPWPTREGSRCRALRGVSCHRGWSSNPCWSSPRSSAGRSKARSLRTKLCGRQPSTQTFGFLALGLLRDPLGFDWNDIRICICGLFYRQFALRFRGRFALCRPAVQSLRGLDSRSFCR